MFRKVQIPFIQIISIVAILALTPVSPARAAGQIYRVSTAGLANPACGDSWANTCNLSDALNTLVVAGDEIWVKEGTYLPPFDPESGRGDSFYPKSGVALYGGFAGTETLREERDFNTHVTILSGDTGIPGDNSDNSGSLIYIYGTLANPNTATLDGLTITGGNANVDGIVDMGGGIYNHAGNPTLSNLIITGNYAYYLGGGMANQGGSPILTNVTFSNNSALGQGGGMASESGNPTLTNVTFTDNSTSYGGGGLAVIYSANITLTDVIFSHNSAPRGGGMEFFGNAALNNATFDANQATLQGGGISFDNSSSGFASLTITNVTFSHNSSSDKGGALYINRSNSPDPVLKNITFANNTAVNGNTIYNSAPAYDNGFMTIQNSILWTDGTNNGAQIVNAGSAYVVISDSVVEGGYPGGTNIIADDPLLGVLGDNGGYTRTIPLLSGSPAIDAGNDTDCAATDQRGITRPQGAACDIGAFEYDGDAIPPSVISVTLVSTSPTSAASVDFTVTFSEPVSGVDSADFALTKTGSITGYAITNVSPASGPADTYTVSVATGKYNGTLRLDVLNDGSIQDGAGNSLASGYTGGETYTITKSYKAILKSTGSQDGWTLESGEKTNKGGLINAATTTLRLGDNAQKKQYRSILSFSTKGLPDKAVITKVTLKVRRQGASGGGNPVNLFQGFMVDIKKGLFGTSALQAADFQAQADKSVGPFTPALVNGWYTLNLTSAKAYVNKLATSGGLTQIRLRFKLDDNNDAVANILSLYSGNAAAASRPQLIIEYYVP
ncbi:MAG: choice-of-anchor Q domain-containing protein [Chloroflexota bacterium]